MDPDANAPPVSPNAPGSPPTLLCPKCGTPLVNITSGSVCGAGCPIGLMPRVPIAVSRLAEAVMQGKITLGVEKLPGMSEGEYHTREIFAFSGVLYRRVPRTSDKERPACDLLTQASDGLSLIQLRPWAEGNEAIANSLKGGSDWTRRQLRAPPADLAEPPAEEQCEVVKNIGDPGGPSRCMLHLGHGGDHQYVLEAAEDLPAVAPPAKGKVRRNRKKAEPLSAPAAEDAAKAFEPSAPELTEDPWGCNPAERTAWFGVIERGALCPWDTAAGPVTIHCHHLKRGADGKLQFGVGDPDSPFWISLDGFGTEWPADHSPAG